MNFKAIITGLVFLFCFNIGAEEFSESEKKFVDASQKFAVDLYGKLKQETGNFVFSPYNVYSLLEMTYAGASGQTEEQMRQVLYNSLKNEELAKVFGRLNRRMILPQAGMEDPFCLLTANELWIEAGVPVEPLFRRTIQQNYLGKIGEVNFKTNSAQAIKTINDSVKIKTAGKIANLFSANDISASTRFVLASAIYFKAPWKQMFDKELTKENLFYSSKKDFSLVPFMEKTGSFRYWKSSGVAVVELLYDIAVKNAPNFSLLIVLPDAVDGLFDVEKKLSSKLIQQWVTGLANERVQLQIPKFKIANSFGLNSLLEELGMKDAFSLEADFSKMTSLKPLSISSIVHKTFLEVDENGTEAAAASGASFNLTSVFQPNPPIQFKADHPFLFFVVDADSGLILFMGRVIKG